MVYDLQGLDNKIEEMIYEIRGLNVILDSNLAKLFDYKGGTKVINQALKRNAELFDEESYFQLTPDELKNLQSQKTSLRSQPVTTNMVRSFPYAFTLEGIKILSTILRKPNVPSVTERIIKAFEGVADNNNHGLAIPLSKGEKIENLIYEIRGKQVMLDFDLARIYECRNGTKTINLAVKRHLNMFKNDIYFQLTENEFLNLKFQFETSSWNEHGGIRKLPYAFTEEGVYMLATIIRTEVAEEVTAKIIRAFVTMRRFIGNNLIEQKYINNQVLIMTEHMGKTDKKIEKLETEFEKLQNAFSEVQNNKPLTYFEGHIFDAHYKLIEIMKEAKEELIVIDRYADLNVLDMISKVEVPVILVVGIRAKISELDIEKYNSNYNNLTLIVNDSFHDRYIILDRKTIYHCGTSLNSAGLRTFSINKWSDEIVVNPFIQEIEKIISSIVL